jgi:hypothetical protein
VPASFAFVGPVGPRLLWALALLPLATALSACPTEQLGPKHYACARDAGEAACPFGWHCGVEGFCYSRSAEAGRDYPCEGSTQAPDEDCVEGWRCGLEGRCRRRDAGYHLCRTPAGELDESYCEGWRCALEGRCRPKEPGAHPCRTDAGVLDETYCEGWVCGIDGTCHPAGAGPWPCTGDEQCAGWRCGLAGRCLDPGGDALDFAGFPVALPAQPLSPKAFTALPQLLSASSVERRLAGAPALLEAQGLALYDDAGLAVFSTRVDADDAGVRTMADFHRLDLPSAPQAIAATASGAFVLDVAGELRHYELRDGGLWPGPGLARTGTWLRALSAPVPLALLGPERTAFDAMTLVGTSNVLPLPELRPKASIQPAVLGAAQLLGPGGGGLLALTPNDLFFLPVDPSNPSAGGPDAGWCEVPLSMGKVLMENRLNAAGAVEARGGLAAVEVDGRYVLLGPVSAGEEEGCPAWIPQRALFGPCVAACPTGYFAASFGPVISPQGIEVLCQPFKGSGLVTLTLSGVNDSCLTQPSAQPVGMARDRATAQTSPSPQVAVAGAHGQLWMGPTVAQAHPVTLERAPAGVTLLGGQLVAFTREVTALLDPTYGLRTVPSNPNLLERPVAAVAGRPGWLLLAGGLVVRAGADGGWDLLAIRDFALEEFVPPYSATVAGKRDGGTQLVIASGDALFGADLSAPDSGTAALELRLIPSTRSPILAVAPLPPASLSLRDGGTPLLGGYAITPDRAYLFYAETERRWRAEELPVPDGELAKLWTDGARGRIGYRDGRVVSLPNALLLAPAMEEVSAVEDFGALCGQPFALTEEGLWRVSPAEQGALGRWSPVSLQSGLPGALAEGLKGGRLFSSGETLLLFTSFGAAARFSPDGGCPSEP